MKVAAAFAIAVGVSVGSMSAGTEVPVSSVVYTGAPYDQNQVEAASDGTNFLVAWRDSRVPTLPERIFAARVGSDGRLLDTPTSIAVPDPSDKEPTSSTNAPPTVFWCGSVYVVAWPDDTLFSMRFVRINAEGKVLDAMPQTITGLYPFWYGSASSGSGALLVYVSRDGKSVRGALFDAQGDIVMPDIVLPHATVDDQPAVASNGANYFVTWRRWDGQQSLVMGTVVSRDGIPGDAALLATTWSGPAIASNGSDYLIAYIDQQKKTAVAHLDGNGHPVSRHSVTYTTRWPFLDNTIAKYGRGYILEVIDQTNGHVSGVVLDPDGNVAGETPLTTNEVPSPVAIASSATQTLVAWPENRFGGSLVDDVYSRMLGSADGDTLISSAAVRQHKPRIATSPSGGLAVWLEYRGGDDAEVRAMRLSREGVPLDPQPLLVGNHAEDALAVAFDGKNFVVVWQRRVEDDPGLMIHRISPEGVLLDAPSGRLAVRGYFPSFALGSNRRDTVLTWTGSNPDFSVFVKAAQIGRDGTVGSPVEVETSKDTAVDLTIGSDGQDWLIAWTDIVYLPWCSCGISPPPTDWNVRAVRISKGMNVLDSTPVPIAIDPTLNERNPSIASDGVNYLIGWVDNIGPYTVHVRSVSAQSGVMGEATQLGAGDLPSIAWVGNDYVVAWQNDRDLFYTHMRSRWIAPLAASADNELNVNIVPIGDDAFIAAYERIASERLYGTVPRAFVRVEALPIRPRVVRH
jgi:hypothetical protein